MVQGKCGKPRPSSICCQEIYGDYKIVGECNKIWMRLKNGELQFIEFNISMEEHLFQVEIEENQDEDMELLNDVNVAKKDFLFMIEPLLKVSIINFVGNVS